MKRKLLPTLALALALTGAARAENSPIPFSGIGAKATADYQGDALAVTATTEGARLRCAFQKLEGRATAEGLWLESTEPGAAGKLRLVAVGVGREVLECGSPLPLWSAPASTESGRGVPQSTTLSPWVSLLSVSGEGTLPATGTVSVEGKPVRFIRPGLTEEYSVSVDGVRQDFVITERPAGEGELCVELALTGARAEAAAYGAKLTLEGSGRALAYSRLRAADATGQELTARLEVFSTDRLAVCVTDANASYPVRIDPTFSDADWVSLNPGLPGATATVRAIVADGSGNVYFGGDFTAIGTVVANHIAKWNGSRWSALGSGMNDNVLALAVSGTNLYAGGWFDTAGEVTANCIAKWNGSAWSALASGVESAYGPEIDALAVSGTNLYAGGGFTTAGGVAATNIAKWDGSGWSALGSGMNGTVGALAVSGTNLYAGGHFSTAGGVTATYIAKWDGSAWSALGSGMDRDVLALAVSGTNLYAGGQFNTAGGVTAHGIAKWDGSAWSELGSGLGSGMSGGIPWVNALAVSGTNLYAGGPFTTAGGVTAEYIAKWNGSAWSALGLGMDGPVYALAVSGTNLYAGGWFITAGPVPANYVAKWNGSAWSALGSGMDGSVLALAVSGTNLYAGGQFYTAGGVTVNAIAKWDGSTWSGLGSGMSGGAYPWVYALAVSGTSLYAGGIFSTAGGVTANCIAKWDGSAWSALASGVGGTYYEVDALAVSGTNLYAGGFFDTAGGVTVNCIAKWDGSAWSALGSGMDDFWNPNQVFALAVSGTSLYVGGGCSARRAG
jgi:hypothetical protein